jgi:phosphonate degradation associated HDIG domain protein
MSQRSIDEIVDLYHAWGDENYDEDVSQISHARQCAALAIRDGADEKLCIAALLHDIGHLFELSKFNGPNRSTNLHHEQTGSSFLAEMFPPAVTIPIALHVDAKRHLTAVDPDYEASLSRGSRRSLDLQGGPYSPTESKEFLNLAGSAEAVRLRRWDDHGKVIGLEVPEFDSWIPMMRRIALL